MLQLRHNQYTQPSFWATFETKSVPSALIGQLGPLLLFQMFVDWITESSLLLRELEILFKAFKAHS